jgi:small multidrug resistance family-3 protein
MLTYKYCQSNIGQVWKHGGSPCRSTPRGKEARVFHTNFDKRGTALPSGQTMPELIKLGTLFALTALAEIIGCYLPWLVIKQGKPLWLLLPAAFSLTLFAWLLTLHPNAAGRTYAAYGSMYIAVALLWLRFVDGVPLSRWDALGALLALGGMAVIALQPRG